MIHATQLRIGNYVQDIISGEWMIVDELVGSNVGATLINRDKFPLKDGWQMGYIPLTPEILEKMGLKLEFGGQLPDYFLIKGVQLFWFGDELSATLQKNVEIYIKHVHTLQNFVHALTGEELIIKLNTEA